MEIIKLENVTKEFKVKVQNKWTILNKILNRDKNEQKIQALKNISFSINKGEFVGIIGPNASGKTTLLKLISQILQPTFGTVESYGTITSIFETRIVFNQNLTISQNIKYYGTILGMAPKEINKKMNNILKFAKLNDYKDRYFKELSKGMKARIAFSTAAMTGTDIFLFDELFAVGDIYFKKRCYRLLNLKKKYKKTILFISHNLEHISKLCDRAILLIEGEIKMFDKADKVVKYYKDLNKLKD